MVAVSMLNVGGPAGGVISEVSALRTDYKAKCSVAQTHPTRTIYFQHDPDLVGGCEGGAILGLNGTAERGNGILTRLCCLSVRECLRRPDLNPRVCLCRIVIVSGCPRLRHDR